MTLVSIPANPVPEDVVSGTIKTPDGAELRFARWAPPANRKGTVCVFTGRSEQIEKYFETVRDLRDRGFAVAMIDWRGQGHSSRRLRDPRKGYVRDFSDYEVDVETFVQQVVLPDCPPPHFALAHSMGGAVLLRVAHAGKRWFDRMVLSAPMIDLPGHRTSFPARALLRVLRLAGQGGRYIPGGSDALTGADSFVNNPLTSDPVRYARNVAILEEDPTLGLANPPADPDAGRLQRRHCVDVRDRGIRLSFARRLASRDRRLETRNPAGAGPLPRPVLGGVRRVRAGHAAVQVRRLTTPAP
jgi:lysophospholipase